MSALLRIRPGKAQQVKSRFLSIVCLTVALALTVATAQSGGDAQAKTFLGDPDAVNPIVLSFLKEEH